jgi:hypothetical protein
VFWNTKPTPKATSDRILNLISDAQLSTDEQLTVLTKSLASVLFVRAHLNNKDTMAELKSACSSLSHALRNIQTSIVWCPKPEPSKVTPEQQERVIAEAYEEREVKRRLRYEFEAQAERDRVQRQKYEQAMAEKRAPRR